MKTVFFAVLLGASSILNTKAEDGSIKILFVGDSITEGYGVSKAEAYPTLVAEELNRKFTLRRMAKRVEAINGGVAGATSASGVSRLRWFLKAKPKVMFLALGANDGLRGLQPSDLEKNLAATITLAQSEGLKVILAGMKLPPNYGKKNSEEFYAVYPKLADQFKIPLLPFILEGVGGEKDLNIEDGIHPNAKGHKKIMELVRPYLEKVL